MQEAYFFDFLSGVKGLINQNRRNCGGRVLWYVFICSTWKEARIPQDIFLINLSEHFISK